MRTFVPENVHSIPSAAKRAFKGVIYDVYQWEQELFDGSTTTFEMLNRPDTVITICVDKDSIVLVKDEQPHVGTRMGIPGGRADVPSEDELAAAQRETIEETGLTLADWRLVTVQQKHSKIDHLIYTFIAFDVTDETDIKPDAGEKIEVQRWSFDKFKKAALAGELIDEIPEQVLECESIEELRDITSLYDYS